MLEMCSCGKPHIPVELRKIELGPNDLLHVVVGMADVGDGHPWIPSQEELIYIRDEVGQTFPGVQAIVTHLAIEMEPLDLTDFLPDATVSG